MKTCLFRAGWVVSIFVVGSCGVGHVAGPIIASAKGTETTAVSMLLPIGTPRALFLETMGPPDAWLTSEVCVYWNRRTNHSQLNRDYDTVLVQFREDRVSIMKIVPGAPSGSFSPSAKSEIPPPSLQRSVLLPRAEVNPKMPR